MKNENFQLCGYNSMCAGSFQLLGAAQTAQLRGNIALETTKELMYT
jgi:hypothetical protein